MVARFCCKLYQQVHANSASALKTSHKKILAEVARRQTSRQGEENRGILLQFSNLNGLEEEMRGERERERRRQML